MDEHSVVWTNLSEQTGKLITLALQHEIGLEEHKDIKELIDCALLSQLHPRLIASFIETHEIDGLRQLVYRQAH